MENTNRTKQIYEAGETLLLERLLENVEAIEKEFQQNSISLCKVFSNKINRLTQKVKEAQTSENKGAIRYLCFSFLQSSLYTNSFDFRMDVYDESFYKDLCETSVYWSPDFIFRYYAEDTIYFRKQIGYQIPRIKEDEIMTFCRSYILHYYRITQQFIQDQLVQVLQEIKNAGLVLADQLTVIFGGYFDRPILLMEKSWGEL